jgi:hypothetical protein
MPFHARRNETGDELRRRQGERSGRVEPGASDGIQGAIPGHDLGQGLQRLGQGGARQHALGLGFDVAGAVRGVLDRVGEQDQLLVIVEPCRPQPLDRMGRQTGGLGADDELSAALAADRAAVVVDAHLAGVASGVAVVAQTERALGVGDLDRDQILAQTVRALGQVLAPQMAAVTAERLDGQRGLGLGVERIEAMQQGIRVAGEEGAVDAIEAGVHPVVLWSLDRQPAGGVAVAALDQRQAQALASAEDGGLGAERDVGRIAADGGQDAAQFLQPELHAQGDEVGQIRVR